MAGQRQKKSSGFSSFFKMFSGKSSRARRSEDSYYRDDFMKAYKVWPSDEDRGRWVAEPGIDKKAAEYICHTTGRWADV